MEWLLKLCLTIILSLSAISCFPVENDEGTIHIMEIEDPDDVIDLSQIIDMIYGNPNNKTGEALSKWEPADNTNPEEIGSYFEGDMLIPRTKPRNGMLQQSLRWPRGIVPYEIRGTFNSHELGVIQRGINQYHTKTCIRLKPRTNERDYISISNAQTGCWSSVGRIGGKQVLNVQTPNCLIQEGTFVHELMHAVGFVHEQNRHERDSYVNVNWDNIQSGMGNNFDKYASTKTSGFGVTYDYGSVMHYSANAFSKNGRPTITAKLASGRNSMGQRQGFSAGDIKKIRAMYRC